MHPQYLVRYGWQQDIARVAVESSSALDNDRPARGKKVVIDCGRGIEVGECLGECQSKTENTAEGDSSGSLIRILSSEDEFVMEQLRLLAHSAYNRCVSWLEEVGSTNVLLEVEPLLDGKTLFFYFLSDPDATIDQQLSQLVSLYESEVAKSDFVKLVEKGCGPDCGTASATSNCTTSSGCSNCKTGCAIRKHSR